MQQQPLPAKTSPTRFLRTREILELVNFSRATLWRFIKNGKFPEPTRLGPNSVGWKLSVYERWAADPEAWKNNTKK